MNENKTNINWFPGHMAKTKKQIVEDLKLIDIVIEILDARIPLSSQNPDVQVYTRNKKKITILNKADLADENITKEWIKHFSKDGNVAIAVQANTGKGMDKVVPAIKELYSDTLAKFEEKGRVGRSAKVMILGIPNVGKSTFINKLAKRNVARAANKPGVTQTKQWIKIDENIDLMDTPGMLWPKLGDEVVGEHLAYIKSIGDKAFDNEVLAYSLLNYLIANYKKNVENRYDINIDEIIKDNQDLIDQGEEETLIIRDSIARKKGAIMSGGRINEQKVSDMILIDFQSGKIGKISIEKP